MELHVSDYSCVILDASFFIKPFPETLCQALSQVRVYIPGTYQSDVAQFQKVISPRQTAIYNQNLDALKKMQLDPYPMNTSEDGHDDIWGVINHAVNNEHKVIVLTSNQLLIQRIVLTPLCVDIYDVGADRFYKEESFLQMKAEIELKAQSGDALTVPEYAKELNLYTSDGTPVHLLDFHKSGAEAHIYQAADIHGILGKVFKEGMLKPSKADNIRKLRELSDTIECDWVLLPQDVLYSDPELTKMVGYLEREILAPNRLDEDPMYCGDWDDPGFDHHRKCTETIQLCLMLARQVAYLNVFGIYLSDFNLNNFARGDGSHPYIYMWDSDSFCQGAYFSDCLANDLTPSVDYDTSTKLGAIRKCSEMLYLRVFSLLALGWPPFSAIPQEERKFLFMDPDFGETWRKCFIPDNLWMLFEKVFSGGCEPSAEILIRELAIALMRWKGSAYTDLSYQEALNIYFADEPDDEELLPKYEDRPDVAPNTWREDEVEYGLQQESESSPETGRRTLYSEAIFVLPELPLLSAVRKRAMTEKSGTEALSESSRIAEEENRISFHRIDGNPPVQSPLTPWLIMFALVLAIAFGWWLHASAPAICEAWFTFTETVQTLFQNLLDSFTSWIESFRVYPI